VYIPNVVWIGSFIVGVIISLCQQIVWVDIDDENQIITIYHWRPFLFYMSRRSIAFDNIRDVRVIWRGEKMLQKNRRKNVSALFHSERSLIQSSTTLKIRYGDDREKNKTIDLDILEFDDFLHCEKPFVSKLNRWCDILREHLQMDMCQ